MENKSSNSLLASLASNRQQVGIGMIVAGLLLASMAIWFGVWGFARSQPLSVETIDGKIVQEEVEKPKADDKPKKSPDYQIASIWAGALALTCFLSALWLFSQEIDPTGPEATIRKEILFFGGIVGLLTSLAGFYFGYRWHPSLVKWVGAEDASEAKWVFYAFAIFLAGLLIMFASIQLARPEERNNANLRRVLYGFNAVFVGLLLLLVLIAVNVVAFIRVPNTLVTNDAAFTELSDESKRFLSKLDRPVHVYLIMPENYSEQINARVSYDNLYADCRGFLTQCEDQSRNFTVKYLSPAFDKEQIAVLMERLKIKETDRDQLGMLATVGENEEASTFIRSTELIDNDRRGQLVFQGENKLLTELMFLTDARAKEKIYFLQGHGELNIDPGEDGEKSVAGIVQFLRDRRLNVDGLKLETPDAKIPEDAAVVVIAGFTQPVPQTDPLIGALREYLQRPNKPGKLFVCVPAFRGRDNRVSATGLEPLFAEYGVEIDPSHRLLGVPVREVFEAPPDYILARPYDRLDIDLARAVGRVPLVLRDARPVQPSQNAVAGQFRVTRMFGTLVQTWQEEDFATNPALALRDIANDRTGQVRAAKRFSNNAVSVAVAVTEQLTGDKPVQRPRMVVFGGDTFLRDQGSNFVGDDERRKQFVSDMIDWLRERDAAGIPPRKVTVYSLEKPIETSNQLVLLVMVTLGIVSLGVSVWLSRRR